MRSFKQVGLLWPGIGFAGSLLSAVAATGLLAHRPVSWWWVVSLGTHGVQWHLFWAGVVVLCLAWLGLGRRLLHRPGTRPRDVLAVTALWALPLALGPALFSLDMYSYLAQGALLAHGLNPYHTTLRALHEPALMAGVSSTWRHTTTPYGPVFVALASLAARVAGSHVTLGVTLLRLPVLLGLGLLAWSIPRLARQMGADPVRATWLALGSPLTLLYLVGGGHNDALMIGLMVAGVYLAVAHRPLAGIALCALAATIKLPAAAAVVMIAVCCWRAQPARRWQVLAAGALVVAVVALMAGFVADVGTSWMSSSLVSTPATARIALTPSTAIAVTLWELTHHFGAGVEQTAASWENAATTAAYVLVGLAAVILCLRVRFATLPRYLGFVLLIAALGGPAAWPWYLSWGLVLLAADRRAQTSWWLPVALIVTVLPVMAGGQVAVPLPDAWWVVLVYTGALLVAMFRSRIAAHLDHLRRHAQTNPPDSPSPISHVTGESNAIVTSDLAR